MASDRRNEMASKRVCPNCKHELTKEGHFVPPCFGDAGMFVCADICEECKAATSPSVPSEPSERTLDDAGTDAALRAVESMLPPASKPERSGTCPTCS